MKIAAFVPIKLNNQRIKNKNILPLGGKPLCWHIFNTLLEADGIDEVYCYCSDEAVKQYLPEGATFLRRDPVLDGDLVKGFQIYERFITDVSADAYALCHATSPFIKKNTIERAARAIRDEGFDSAFAAQRWQSFAWYDGRPLNYDPNDVPRTQDIEPVFMETSAFFMFRKEVFSVHRRRIGFKPYLCETDAVESVDIDEPEDYEFAKIIAREVLRP